MPEYIWLYHNGSMTTAARKAALPQRYRPVRVRTLIRMPQMYGVGRMTIRIAISAGEVSGDQHLGRVVRSLRATIAGVEIRGMGGRDCRDAGADILVDSYQRGAAMGFSELLRSARGIFHSFSEMKALLATWKPHLLIVVDYPDFNLRLARYAKKLDIPVLYFIPPKVWAWRQWRVNAIKRYVDVVAAIFPFEKAFYADRGYTAVRYVGHPLADTIREEYTGEREHSILMLPGSRKFEVTTIFPAMLRVFERIASRDSKLTGVVLAAPNMKTEALQAVAQKEISSTIYSKIRWSSGDPIPEMQRAQVGILKSGTCNLEGAIAGIPFVSVYSTSRLSKMIIDTLVPLTEYSPVNIIRSGTVREVMDVPLDESAIEREVEALLNDRSYREKVLTGLKEVRTGLHASDDRGERVHVADRVARVATEMLQKRKDDV